MSDSIKLYHGTKNIEGVIRREAIQSPYRQNGEKVWEVYKQRYDLLTNKFAQIARDYIAEVGLIAGFGSDPNLLEMEEALADLIQDHHTSWIDIGERLRYKELKRNLFIYLANTYNGAGHHTESRIEGETGAILVIDIPRTLLRPSFREYCFENECGVSEVPKEINLEHLNQIYVSKEDLAKVSELLIKQGHTEIKIDELN